MIPGHRWQLLLAALLASSCVYDRTGQSRPYQMYQSIESNRSGLDEAATRDAELDARVARLRIEETQYRERVAEAGANLDGVLEALTRLRGQVEELRTEVRERGALDEEVDYRLLSIESRLGKMEQLVAQSVDSPLEQTEPDGDDSLQPKPSPEVPDTPEPPQEVSSEPQDPPKESDPDSEDSPTPSEARGGPDDVAFASALESYRAKNWSKAGRSFAAFTRKFPDSPHATEAAFLRADTLFQQAQYNGAIAAFQVVIDEWPKATRAASAMFMQGASFEAMGDGVDAVVFYQEVARLYPDSPEAAEGLKRIESIEQ